MLRRLFHSQFSSLRHCSAVSMNSFTSRTHTCGELRSTHIGQQVTVCGWIQYIRGSRFLALRDSYGRVQATIPDGNDRLGEVFKNLSFEAVVMVKGKVGKRPEKDKN